MTTISHNHDNSYHKISTASANLTATLAEQLLPWDTVELHCDQLYFLCELLQVSLPWALALIPPYVTHSEQQEHQRICQEQLTAMSIMDEEGRINSHISMWIHTIAQADSRLELRFSYRGDMLRGVIVNAPTGKIAIFRNAQLVTITSLPIWDAHDLVPSLTAGFVDNISPAQFTSFSFDIMAGVEADAALRYGAPLATIAQKLNIPTDSWEIISAAWKEHGCQVEIIAYAIDNHSEYHSEVGCTILESTKGLILMEAVPSDGQNLESITKNPQQTKSQEQYNNWKTVCQPATDSAIARSITNLLHSIGVTDWFSQ